MVDHGKLEFKTLDHLDPAGKRIAVRVDLNSSIDPNTGKIVVNERFRAHAKTVKELLDRGGKVVVLAHQGRRGDHDFTDLSQHAEILSQFVGKNIRFVPDVAGVYAVEAVKNLSTGEAILLDNVRILEDEDVEKTPEEHAQSTLPRTLSGFLDAFVLDAFSVAHRSHASVVGLAVLLPTYAGRVMESELTALNRYIALSQKLVFLLGGNKPQECLKMLIRFLETRPNAVQAVLTGGVLGQLFVKLQGHELGKENEEFLRKKKYLDLMDKVRVVAEKAGEKILSPIDFAYAGPEEDRKEILVRDLPAPGLISDIGPKTLRWYCETIEALDSTTSIIVKGPMGVYEKPQFREGTKKLYEALAVTRAATFIGGGDSVTAIELLNFRTENFTFVSLGGGALITYLSGERMPGIEVLMKSPP